MEALKQIRDTVCYQSSTYSQNYYEILASLLYDQKCLSTYHVGIMTMGPRISLM